VDFLEVKTMEVKTMDLKTVLFQRDCLLKHIKKMRLKEKKLIATMCALDVIATEMMKAQAEHGENARV
jgi:hypothetical protein